MSLISFASNESLVPSGKEDFPPLPSEFYAPLEPSQQLGVADFFKGAAVLGMVFLWAFYSKLTSRSK